MPIRPALFACLLAALSITCTSVDAAQSRTTRQAGKRTASHAASTAAKAPAKSKAAAKAKAPAKPPVQLSAAPSVVPGVPAPPPVDARGFLVIDAGSGQTLAELNPDARMEPASITKLMTAYLTFQALRDGKLKLTDEVTISEHAWKAEGSRTFLQVGTTASVDVLLKGMIVQSGNDATIALAERIGGTEPGFVAMMNTEATKLGLKGTHYENADGLPSPTHYSTARDIATLARAIIRDFPDRYALYSVKEFTWNNIKQPNRNGLLWRDPSVDGMKTGHTDSAGYCLVTSAKRENTRLISVVLGSSGEHTREDASAALLNYGYTYFETASVKKAGEMVLKPRVYKSAGGYAAVGPATDVQITVPRGQAGGITTAATTQPKLIAPLATTTQVGELVVTLAGKDVAHVPLYPQAAVAEGGLWTRLVDTIALWFK